VANTCRFSSVYGWPFDHANRVAMAFATTAVLGGTVTIEGSHNVFDFTFVDDVVDGLMRLIDVTCSGVSLPPVHFVSGVGTSLSELAQIAAEHARQAIIAREAPARTFDVGHFVGDPVRAEQLLGWSARTDVRSGIARLIDRIDQAGAMRSAPIVFPAKRAAKTGKAEPVKVAGSAG
jgi:nucleoside-diphosphate-sugar epimerase